MTEWKQEDVAHKRKIGVFEILVWPIKATPEHPYVAWARVPTAGDFDGLLTTAKPRLRVKFESLTEAKRWIEDEMRKVCQDVSRDLGEKQSSRNP